MTAHDAHSSTIIGRIQPLYTTSTPVYSALRKRKLPHIAVRGTRDPVQPSSGTRCAPSEAGYRGRGSVRHDMTSALEPAGGCNSRPWARRASSWPRAVGRITRSAAQQLCAALWSRVIQACQDLVFHRRSFDRGSLPPYHCAQQEKPVKTRKVGLGWVVAVWRGSREGRDRG